jgi:non-specific serine/threonine protein kinase
VAQLCRRLDGLPLALELAAARLRALTVEQLASRLDDRFHLLTGGSRADLPRHQTLRGALDWSYDLLTEPERVNLRRLSIFAGGFTLEAAEAVCGNEVLNLLDSLVDQSLVQPDREGRFRLLETIREYALERLHEAGEHRATGESHAAWAVALAEAAEIGLQGPEQVAWLSRLADEMDNFRAAMEGSLNRQEGETAGRLIAALARFFHWRGYVTEGRGWLERALSVGESVSPATRARLLYGAAALCHEQAEGETARRYAEESLSLRRQLDDRRGVAASLEQLGHVVNLQGDLKRAVALFEESLATARAIGDAAGTATALNALGYMAWFNDDHERATALCEESLRLRRSLSDPWGIAYSLEFLGLALAARKATEPAMRALEECLELRRQLADKRGVAAALMQLGFAAFMGGDPGTARRHLQESLPLWREVANPDNAATVLAGLGATHRGLGEYGRSAALYVESLAQFERIAMTWGIAECLEGLARTAQAAGEFPRSLRFAGLAEATREGDALPIKESKRLEYAQWQAAAAATLGDEACAAVWAEGRRLSLDQAIAEAREIGRNPASESHQAPGG